MSDDYDEKVSQSGPSAEARARGLRAMYSNIIYCPTLADPTDTPPTDAETADADAENEASP